MASLILSCTETVVCVQAAWLEHQGVQNAGPADLQTSLDALRVQGKAFLDELKGAGWSTDLVTIRTGSARFAQLQQ
jgi:hypothetical protein